MMNKIPDLEVRKRALDIDQSFIVQAPAGSGKTELLTQRILKLLTVVERPENILAITFTRKAAAEMKNRIFQSLSFAHEVNTLPAEEKNSVIDNLSQHKKYTLELSLEALKTDRQLSWNIINNPNRLQVKTIDSLCSSLVSQLPFLSKLGGQARIIEDSSEIYEQAVQEFMKNLEKDNQWGESIRKIMIHLDKRSDELASLLVALLARRIQWAHLVIDFRNQSHASSLDLAHKHLELAIEDIINNYFGILSRHKGYKKLLELDSFIPHILENLPEDSQINGLSGHHDIKSLGTDTEKWRLLNKVLFTQKNELKKRVTKNDGFPVSNQQQKNIKKSFMDFLSEMEEQQSLVETLLKIDKLPANKIDKEQIEITADICECLTGLLAQLYTCFMENKCLDFSELQLKAIDALSPDEPDTGDSPVSLALDAKIQHILVDEYQDTSNSQLVLLERLVQEWQYQDDNKTLFLVGDPMQSIYRFREAEVGIFLKTTEGGVNNQKLEKLTLQSNFRSTTEIVDWVNCHFSRCFPEKNDIQTGAICYSPSAAISDGESNSGVKLMLQKENKSSETGAAQQAQQLVETIKAIRSTKPNESIAILVRSRNHLKDIIPQLKQQNVPFKAIDIDALSDTPSIIQLINLSKTLLDISDKLAWIGLLRSSMIGLENKDLLEIKKFSDEKQTSIGALLTSRIDIPLSNTTAASKLKKTQECFSKAYRLKQFDRFSNILERCWLTLGGPASMPAEEIANIKIFMELIRNLENEHETLNGKVIEKACQSLYSNTKQSADNPVSVLTIHKSKGLEFDHVIIPGLEKTPPHDKKNILNWNIHEDRRKKQYFLLAPLSPVHKSIEEKQLYDYLESLEKEKAFNENIRLFYVAATRAKTNLYLFGMLNEKVDKEGNTTIQDPSNNSLLNLIWGSVKQDEIEFIENCQNPSENNNEENPYSLTRLAHDWNNIDFLESYQSGELTIEIDFNNENTSINELFDSGNTESTKGTLYHLAISQWARNKDFLSLDLTRLINSSLPFWKKYINEQGIFSNNDVENIISECTELLLSSQNDDSNNWIFDRLLESSSFEQELLFLNEKNRHKKYIIDRTFVKNNERWIVDFKTSKPGQGQDLDSFLKEEEGKYSQQLDNYARTIRLKDSRPQRLALYFPAIQTLYEVSNISISA